MLKVILHGGDGGSDVASYGTYKEAHSLAVSMLEDEHGYESRLKRSDVYISRDKVGGKRQWELRIITGRHGITSDIYVEIIEV